MREGASQRMSTRGYPSRYPIRSAHEYIRVFSAIMTWMACKAMWWWIPFPPLADGIDHATLGIKEPL
ncbi:hypothetical protein BRADI_1g09633v3 [Brachypodium distachyon]|uniref:Uncharacterized protein n=1 Tax=Brachypodium distachyon TaxID=15368 RepID=A0A2K2DIT9_BRADI|nr:hypothetical protein BRADI_1g09633v3 [Brachypodium distachyon]